MLALINSIKITMKGILFFEFLEFLENRIGETETQEIIDNADLKSNGAYSRVGFYDYQELIQLLTGAASQTGEPAEALLQAYAEHLFGVFKRDYSVFFENTHHAIDMLKTIDDHIHVEVKKLYPDAELPKFEYEEKGDQLHLHYESPRPLAGVALALVNACLSCFDNKQELAEYTIADDHKSASFIIAHR